MAQKHVFDFQQDSALMLECDWVFEKRGCLYVCVSV